MATSSPMISVPLKTTGEIDWVQPLKGYIRSTYGDDPNKYDEECHTLNRLRQDMRGAGKESAAGRDLLYRYYGQLELLDLRFPVDENHIKISFTWFDAFTQKPTSQYSLAYEKASIIFNISAVLSCHAAYQTRSEEAGLKTAYHSFQASAGMFTYINENFLHAPSTDLSRDTVKTLIHVMLAQAQEVFLEKQVADGKKVGLLAKLASQAAYLHSQALEGVIDNVNKSIFEKIWLTLTQIKVFYTTSLAQYYQALADDDANNHGNAIARLQVAEASARDGLKLSGSFPTNPPPASNLGTESASSLIELHKRHLAIIVEKLAQMIKDNDYIYHQTIPAEAALPPVPKLPAAKAIPVSELYAGQDIQRITGPDIFRKIVPIQVTESASLYDEEKAKLIRAESEKVEIADGELDASLDYLRLPGALNVLRGGSSSEIVVDREFKAWCDDLVGLDTFTSSFNDIRSSKDVIFTALEKSSKQLDMEESVCEKMRSKHESEWTQQPSSRLTTTLRNDIRSYREGLLNVGSTDESLLSKMRQHERDFDEMRSAGETGEADVLFQTALLKAGGKGSRSMDTGGSLLDDDFVDNDGPSIIEQVNKVDAVLEKLRAIKRERQQVLKDLKEKIHNDDISQVLILNKKAISNYESQLFQAELEKFRPYQTRLLQANHKQASLMKDLTASFNLLLQDKRVRSEQNKLEAFSRQRSTVMNKYKKTHEDFIEIRNGLDAAKQWYSSMRNTVNSLEKNVESFVNNRRTEGAQLLSHIESGRTNDQGGQAEKMRAMMSRMSVDSPKSSVQPHPPPRPQSRGQQYGSQYPPPTPQYHYQSQTPAQQYIHQNMQDPYGRRPGSQASYDPNTYNQPKSPPPAQQNFSQSGYTQPQQAQYQQFPPGYVPPPPPPGPPPLGPQQTFPTSGGGYEYQVGNGHGNGPQTNNIDPFAGLSGWR